MLDLSGGLLSDAGAESLLARASDFARLQTLNLDGHRMSDAVVEEIRHVCKGTVGEPRDDDDDRIDTGEVFGDGYLTMAVPRRGP